MDERVVNEELGLRAKEVRRRLHRAMPEPKCELDHRDAWQLTVATILSAQSTDKMVNRVTPALFERWPTPSDLAAADRAEVERMIKSTGFFRNKAKSIQGAAELVATRFGGRVPRTMKKMLLLPGVARKTANVVLGTAYRISTGMTVDTHAGRVSRRLGLTTEQDPKKVERDLCELFHKRSWIDMGHRFVLHGRYVCKSQSPQCEHCPLNEICPAREMDPIGRWTQRAEAQRRTVTSSGEVAIGGQA